MFSEAHAGVYKDKVHWFIGVENWLVHVTLHDNDNDNIFYDFLLIDEETPVFTDEMLETMCELYIMRFIDGDGTPLLTEGGEDDQRI